MSDAYVASSISKRYALKKVNRFMFIFVALIQFVFAGYLYSRVFGNFNMGANILTFLIIVFVLEGLFFLVKTMDYVEVDYDSIHLRNFPINKTIRKSEVQAFERTRTRNGTVLILKSLNPEEKLMRVPESFQFDEEWNEWVGTLQELEGKNIFTAFKS